MKSRTCAQILDIAPEPPPSELERKYAETNAFGQTEAVQLAMRAWWFWRLQELSD